MSSISGIFNLGGGVSLAEPTSVHRETGFVISADARIDYRDELLTKLGLDSNSLSDTEVILQAYLRWGEDCLDHLLGDFAFAIWNPRESQLFCARDHFGVRPFYYHQAPGQRFVFASDARSIFRVPEVPYAINDGRVADFLVPELEWIDYTSTFYEGVFRLPPGHKLVVTPDSFTVSEYCTPAPGPELPSMSDEEYRDGLLEVLTRAVDARLRMPQGKVGIMLSGGMDSGSVAALATELVAERGDGRLRTVSAARKRGEVCEESQRIYATVDKLGTKSTIVDPEDIEALDDQLLVNIAEPFDAEFLFMKAIFVAAKAQGLEVLLDGAGGDLVLNESSHIKRLLRQGRIVRAYREILAAPRFWGVGNALSELFLTPLRASVPEFIRSAINPRRRRMYARRFVTSSLISPEFARRVDIDARCERMWSMFPPAWTPDPALERVRKIRPNVAAGRERYARLAASVGVVAADPFLDLNVVAYCSRLPGHLLLKDGWPKFILREAMAGKLPNSVRWGRGKPHIGWIYNQKFLWREGIAGRLSLEGLQNALAGFVEPDKLRRAWENFQAGTGFEPVHSAYVLSSWLAQSETRPVVKDPRFR